MIYSNTFFSFTLNITVHTIKCKAQAPKRPQKCMLSGQSEAIGGTDRWESLRKTRSPEAKRPTRFSLTRADKVMDILPAPHFPTPSLDLIRRMGLGTCWTSQMWTHWSSFLNPDQSDCSGKNWPSRPIT